MHEKMNLESLPNELLIYLFEFLSTNHIFYAFQDLNSRFDGLLVTYITKYGIDFRSMYLQIFSRISRDYFSKLIDKVPHLYLSKDNCLCRLNTHGFALSQFLQLKSLVLSYLSLKQVSTDIMLALPQLHNLTYLTLKSCRLPRNESKSLSFMNCIWNLSKLTHCCIDETNARIPNMGNYLEMNVVSSSITHLSILGSATYALNLVCVWKHTPNLQRCIASIDYHPADALFNSPALSITSFELFISYSEYDLFKILQCLPNLYRLKVECATIINGQEWENFISRHLPKLKRFNFRMDYYFAEMETTEEEIDKVMDTFRTPFWLVQHHWFIKCDWKPNDICATLYTVPYASNRFYIGESEIEKFTHSKEQKVVSYDAVRHLTYAVRPGQYCQLINIQFHKLESLNIMCGLNDDLWSLIPKFDYLTSCRIESLDNTRESKRQLELLFSHASHLSCLELDSHRRDLSIDKLLLETKIKSFKQLHLEGHLASYNEEECMMLSNSYFAMQCEELHIRVKSRTAICLLVKKMPNLRILFVKCDEVKEQNLYEADDIFEEENITESEITIWLQQNLLDSCEFLEITNCYHGIILRLY